MSVPHDHYLKFIEDIVLEETLFFHSKGNYVINKATQHISTLHHILPQDLEQMTGNELRLNLLPSASDPDCSLSTLQQDHPLKRKDSCEKFPSKDLTFREVAELLSPLLRKEGAPHKRGYPSGGALYPVEVFCFYFNNRILDWPYESKVLHLLPNTRTLEPFTHNIDENSLKQAILPESFDIGSPSLALIYCIYLPKSLFKYRYRGYRLAHLEAGSMYMLVDLRCKELNLQNRLWSGFTDLEVVQRLNLNPTLFLPTCIQFIGRQ